MKITALFTLFFLSISAQGQQEGNKPRPCEETAKSQVEMTDCSHQRFITADKEMNQVYQQLISDMGQDGPKYQKLLREAQRQWLNYRDADCTSEVALNEGGTIYPMMYNYCLVSLTKERTRRMKLILKDR